MSDMGERPCLCGWWYKLDQNDRDEVLCILNKYGFEPDRHGHVFGEPSPLCPEQCPEGCRCEYAVEQGWVTP